MFNLAQWHQRVRALRREVSALGIAARDPRTPWYARMLVVVVVAYALSPIDLIPDFIPVLGYLDDLVLVPLGVVLALRLVPPVVLRESRAQAAQHTQQPPSRAGVAVVALLWLGLATVGVWLLVRWFGA